MTIIIRNTSLNAPGSSVTDNRLVVPLKKMAALCELNDFAERTRGWKPVAQKLGINGPAHSSKSGHRSRPAAEVVVLASITESLGEHPTFIEGKSTCVSVSLDTAQVLSGLNLAESRVICKRAHAQDLEALGHEPGRGQKKMLQRTRNATRKISGLSGLNLAEVVVSTLPVLPSPSPRRWHGIVGTTGAGIPATSTGTASGASLTLLSTFNPSRIHQVAGPQEGLRVFC